MVERRAEKNESGSVSALRSPISALNQALLLVRPRYVRAAGAVLRELFLELHRHDAVLPAIEEVDAEAERHPDEEAEPVRGGEREHQHQATEDAHDRNERHPGAAERPLGVRVLLPHDENGQADDD